MPQRKGKHLSKSKAGRDGFPHLLARPQWGKITSQGASETRRLSGFSALTTNGSGIIGVAFGSTSLRSATEWASYAARYSEYRLLGVRVYFTQPAVIGSSLDGGVLITSTDESGAVGVPSTSAAAWALGNARLVNIDNTTSRPAVVSARAIDLEDQDFTPIGNTSVTFQIIVFTIGPVSTTVSNAYVEYSVEFRSLM